MLSQKRIKTSENEHFISSKRLKQQVKRKGGGVVVS